MKRDGGGRRLTTRSVALVLHAVWLAWPLHAAAAQTLRGTILDTANGTPVPLAGVYLLDRDREVLEVAMADSAGRYLLAVPDSGEYFLFAQRFGYFETESPLLAVSGQGEYGVDMELRPEPFKLDPLEVTVSNQRVLTYLTQVLGSGRSPLETFGFRLLQGARLEEAKLRGKFNPTNTMRLLYIPVRHEADCVRVNAFPRAVSVSGFSGARRSPFAAGAAPLGTISREDALAGPPPNVCGNLYVDGRWMTTDLLDTIDMSQVVAIVTLPGQVRMYTYGYDFSQVGPSGGGPPR